MTISLPKLTSILDRLPSLTIALVGDLFLDRYLELVPGAHELSLETGLEAYQIERVRNSPGALGTVINNLAALGVGRLRPVTVLGDDGHAYDLRHAMASLPLDLSSVILDAERLTPTYTKPLRPTEAGQWEELNRLDVRTRAPLSANTTARLCQALRETFAAVDGLMVLDQVAERDLGVVNQEVRRVLEELARDNPHKLIFVDSRAQLGQFPFGVLKGNRSEILAAVGVADREAESVHRAARSLAERTGHTVFCTLGDHGILVSRCGSEPQQVPGVAVSGPIDIVGAGDAASSGIVVSLLSGADDVEAAAVGNLVASITVQQLGTTGTASPKQVIDRWHAMYGA